MKSDRSTESSYSWEAMLADKRNKLITLLENSKLYDTDVMNALHASRLEDGTYSINVSDPNLINCIKSLIKVMHSLENLVPALLEPLTHYIQSQGFFNSGRTLINLAANSINNRGEIYEFNKNFSLFKSYLNKVRSEVDNKLLLSSNLFPILNQINTITGDTMTSLFNQAKSFQSLPFYQEERIIVDEIEFEPVQQDNENLSPTIRNICTDLVSLETQLADLSNKTKEESYIKNLRQAKEAISQLKIALIHSNRTLNQNKLHIFETLSHIGLTIKAINAINIPELKKSMSNDILETIKMLSDKIEQHIAHIIFQIDTLECKSNLKENSLQFDLLKKLIDSHDQINKSLNITSSYKNSYWIERLKARYQQLELTIAEIQELRAIKTLIDNTLIHDETTLSELLTIKNKIKLIDTPKIHVYKTKIEDLISIKSGMKDLVSEIKKIEDEVRNSHGENDEPLDQLSSLYVLKRQLEDKITELENNNHQGDFYYDTKSKTIIDGHAALLHITSLRIDSETHGMLMSAIEDGLVHSKAMCIQLEKRIANAENNIIDQAKFDGILVEALDSTVELLDKIKNQSPLIFYSMPLIELYTLSQKIKFLDNDTLTSPYQNILANAWTARTGEPIPVKEEEAEKIIQENLVESHQTQGYWNNWWTGNKQKKYDGKGLADWDNAKNQTLKAIREYCLNHFLFIQHQDLFQITSNNPDQAYDNYSISTAETKDEFLNRLNNEKEGSIITIIKSTRKQMIDMTYAYALDPQKLLITRDNDGYYTINITDSLPIKNIKSISNALTRLEQLVNIFNHFPSGVSAIPAIPSILSTIKETTQLLLLDLHELIHHLSQLQIAFPHLPEIIRLPFIQKLNEYLGPTLLNIKNWLSMPGINAVLKIDLTTPITTAITTLQTMNESSNIIINRFDPIQYAIDTLDSLIRKKSPEIIRKAQKHYKSNVIQNIKNKEIQYLMSLVNILLNLQEIFLGTINIADNNTLDGLFKVTKACLKAYEELKELGIPQLENDTKKSLGSMLEENLFPLLKELTISIQFAENKFGINLESIKNNVGLICTKIESTANHYGIIINDDNRYPYATSCVASLSQIENQQNEQYKIIFELQEKLNLIENNNFYFNKITIYELTAIKKALTLLPPRNVATFSQTIDHVIAERSGLHFINESIKKLNDELKKSEKKLLKWYDQLVFLQEANKQTQSIFNSFSYIKNTFIYNNPLSMENIHLLFIQYNNHWSCSFEKFCNLLIDSPQSIIQWVDKEIDQIQNQLAKNHKKLDSAQSNINQSVNLFKENQIKLKIYEEMKENINKKINDNIEIKYDPKTEIITEGKNYPLTTFHRDGFEEAKKIVDNSINMLIENNKELVNNIDQIKIQAESFDRQEYQIRIEHYRDQLKIIEEKLGLSNTPISSLIYPELSTHTTWKEKNENFILEFNQITGLFQKILNFDTDQAAARK